MLDDNEGGKVSCDRYPVLPDSYNDVENSIIYAANGRFCYLLEYRKEFLVCLAYDDFYFPIEKTLKKHGIQVEHKSKISAVQVMRRWMYDPIPDDADCCELMLESGRNYTAARIIWENTTNRCPVKA